MCYALTLSILCLHFLECLKKGNKCILSSICLLTMLSFVFLRLLTWGNPQGGATPLYTAAHCGHKELADILLQNGAEVNAAFEVICNHGKTRFTEMHGRGW